MARRTLLLAMTLCALAVLTSCVLGPYGVGRDDSPWAQQRRDQIVEMIRSGAVQRQKEGYYPYDTVVLSGDLAYAANDGVVVVQDKPFMVFFITDTWMRPDPYCGYEYAPESGTVQADPLGSGHGDAQDLGGGWYWVCAT